jgi:hypothetical protein
LLGIIYNIKSRKSAKKAEQGGESWVTNY